MTASLGQSIALVNFANAWLRGRRENLNWKENLWFAHVEDIKFGMGEPGNQVVAGGPNEWFDSLLENKFKSAALFVDPPTEGGDAYMHVAFAGAGRWAPVTTSDAYDVIWIEKPTFEKRGDSGVWHCYRSGFRVLPGQERIHSSIEDAARALERSLVAIHAFQKRFRPADDFFGEKFETGIGQLRGRGLVESQLTSLSGSDEIFNRVRPLFPTNADPRAIALVAAVVASWALGGMGWWNDWHTYDQSIGFEYKKVTGDYYSALMTSVAAACEPRD